MLEAAEVSLTAWNRDRKDKERVAELQRQLHTLKGGARMAGISAMGDLSHELETLVIQIDGGAVPGDDHAHAVMQASLDELARMRDLVSNGTLPVRRGGLDGSNPRFGLAGRAGSASSTDADPATAPILPPAPEPAAPAPVWPLLTLRLRRRRPLRFPAYAPSAAPSAASEPVPSAARPRRRTNLLPWASVRILLRVWS